MSRQQVAVLAICTVTIVVAVCFATLSINRTIRSESDSIRAGQTPPPAPRADYRIEPDRAETRRSELDGAFVRERLKNSDGQ